MNEQHNQTGRNGSGRPRLLIADDDAFVRSALSAQLGGDFDVVAVAADAVEAIERSEECQPDAALIDVEMPGGGGLEAVRQIATRSPTTCLVVLSSDESRESVVELLNAGAIAYVRKGVPGDQIARTVADSLKAQANLPRS